MRPSGRWIQSRPAGGRWSAASDRAVTKRSRTVADFFNDFTAEWMLPPILLCPVIAVCCDGTRLVTYT
jgi:hypothetical protein